tara:strand:- start:116 stop:481 length:366 start_codon:yes stop_codon:yes gene_type:complete
MLDGVKAPSNGAMQYIQMILRALVQHQVCVIARDAGSRFPNSNRINRGALNATDNIIQLQAMMSGQQANPLNDLQGLLGGVQQPVSNPAPGDKGDEVKRLSKDVHFLKKVILERLPKPPTE